LLAGIDYMHQQDLEPDYPGKIWYRPDPTLDELEQRPLPNERRTDWYRFMKRTQSSMIICAFCKQGIRQHHGRGEGFFETYQGADGLPKRRWFHTRRCWPYERNRRKKEARKELALKQQQEPQTLAEFKEETAKPPEPVPRNGRAKRGLGAKAFEILDSFEPGREFTANDLEEKLKVHGLTTTHGTIQQLIWTYRTSRREAIVVRRETTKGSGSMKVYAFPDPTKQETQRAAEVKALKQELIEERQAAPVVEIGPAQLAPSAPGTMRPLPKSAPTPGLSHADLNRAFNDFQAFILEALADLKAQLAKQIK